MILEYYNQFAEYYDIIYSDKVEDIEFYQLLARKGKQALEIGCGTGRVSIPLARAGIHITGIDNSEKMLAILKKKISNEKLNPRPELILTDMRTLNLNSQFPLIIIPFRSFLHNRSQDDQIKTLKNIKELL